MPFPLQRMGRIDYPLKYYSTLPEQKSSEMELAEKGPQMQHAVDEKDELWFMEGSMGL